MVEQEHINAAVMGAKAATVSAVAASGGGLWAWFGQNHTEVAAICAIVGASCAVASLCYTLVKGGK